MWIRNPPSSSLPPWRRGLFCADVGLMPPLQPLLPILLISIAVSGCGLVKAPFRVAGGLANGAYQGGKKVVNASSDAMEKRKLRKDHEKEQQAKEETRKAGPSTEMIPGPTASPTEGPIIPLFEPISPPQPPAEPALPR